MMIKTTLLTLVAAGLTGCAVYPAAPYGAVYESGPQYEPAPVYVAPAPIYIGGGVYRSYPRGYRGPPVRSHGPRPYPGHPGPYHR